MVGQLRFRLFGHLEIASGRLALPRPDGRKAQELLCLLLLTPSRSLPREQVAETLSPNADPGSSRKQLRQALWQVHQVLDSDAAGGERVMDADPDRVWINEDADVWTDVAEFEAVAGAVEGTPAEELDRSEIEALARATELRRGPLLAGCHEDWCLVRREWLDNRYITGADKLSVAYERRSEHERAIRWARAVLSTEPAHERTHRRLMRLYYVADDRTRALRQYARCRQALAVELGVKPSHRTEALAEAIRADADVERLSAPAGPGPDTSTTVVLTELAALRATLERLHDRVHQRLA